LGVIKILFWRRCRGAQHYWWVCLVRVLLLLFTIFITAENMDTSGVYYMHTTLISHMYPAAKVKTKTAES
jgi:drug/metabolite transporter superfamily protein YnfA